MIIFPAIDLFEKKAVRLLKGDYRQMTVYDDDPFSVAETFVEKGATHVHLVDLEGAKDGTTPNIEIVEKIARGTPLFVEIGGGIRSMDTIDRYISSGVNRVILGTAAVRDQAFLDRALAKYGSRISVGADIKDGTIAVNGWLEKTAIDAYDFFTDMQNRGVSHIICTDISKDGAMKGVNRMLYRTLADRYSLDITASGGVSTLDDITAMRDIGLYGTILGKAYYIGAVPLEKALEVAK